MKNLARDADDIRSYAAVSSYWGSELALAGLVLAFLFPASKFAALAVGAGLGFWVLSFLLGLVAFAAEKIPVTAWEKRRFEAGVLRELDAANARLSAVTQRSRTDIH